MCSVLTGCTNRRSLTCVMHLHGIQGNTTVLHGQSLTCIACCTCFTIQSTSGNILQRNVSCLQCKGSAVMLCIYVLTKTIAKWQLIGPWLCAHPVSDQGQHQQNRLYLTDWHGLQRTSSTCSRRWRPAGRSSQPKRGAWHRQKLLLRSAGPS